MRRVTFILCILILVSGILCIPVIPQSIIHNKDSLRIEIAGLIEQGLNIERKFTKTNLDSSFFLFDSAASLALSNFGESDTLYVNLLLYQSNNRLLTGENDRARELAQKALDVIDEAHFSNSDLRLEALNFLCNAYIQITDFINSAIISEEIINTINQFETKTEYQTRLLIESMGSLGLARLQQGDLSDERFEYSKKRLKLIEEHYGKESQQYAAAYAGLGYDLLYMRRFADAEKYVYKGDSLIKNAYPPEHRLSTWSSILVLLFYTVNGELNVADSILQGEFEIVNRTFGKEHPLYPLLVSKRAQLLLAKDSLDKAIEKADELVKIYRNQASYPTMMLMQALSLLGKIGYIAGNYEVYNKATNELVEIKYTYLFNAFRYASEALKLSYVRRYPVLESILFSGVVQNPNTDIINSAVEMVLNGKGLAFDAMAAQQSASMCANESYLDSLLEKHQEISNRVASMALSSSGTSEGLLSGLFSKKDEIESEISRFCSNLDFSQDRKRATVHDILAALRDNSVFLDFVKYEYYDYEQYYPYGQDSMYAVIIYAKDKGVVITGLGSSDRIDSLIEEYHVVMSDALYQQFSGQNRMSFDKYKAVSNRLYMHLVAPFENHIREFGEIYIAADGMINLLPFGTLIQKNDRFLIENHQFVYLTSGRDLLKSRTDLSGNDVIVMVNPDYMLDPSMAPELASESTPIFSHRGDAITPECLKNMFAPLPKTQQEGSFVANIMRETGKYNVNYFESEMARENTLKNLTQSPDVLHIATHGYFCQQNENSYISNPLLRSGLILAGANRTIGELNNDSYYGADGILTAMEVSGLNLIGTDLVVLSACQSGVGDIQSGEGVFGLRRAFQHAGAKSIIMSLFAVPDKSTMNLMERFYKNWQSGSSKATSLRNAALSIIEDKRKSDGFAHPLFWGGFILAGDPD